MSKAIFALLVVEKNSVGFLRIVSEIVAVPDSGAALVAKINTDLDSLALDVVIDKDADVTFFDSDLLDAALH